MPRRREATDAPLDLQGMIALASTEGPLSGLYRRAIANGILAGEISPRQVPEFLHPAGEDRTRFESQKRVRPRESISLGRPKKRRLFPLEPIVPPHKRPK